MFWYGFYINILIEFQIININNVTKSINLMIFVIKKFIWFISKDFNPILIHAFLFNLRFHIIRNFYGQILISSITVQQHNKKTKNTNKQTKTRPWIRKRTRRGIWEDLGREKERCKYCNYIIISKQNKNKNKHKKRL